MVTSFLTLSIFILGNLANAYQEEAVHFSVAEDISLKGYISKPDSDGKYPALILQMGYGQGSTDDERRTYNPFAEMARKLSDEGFVVLRFDKRGTGYNSANGSFEDATFVDYIQDLIAAIRSVQKRAEVDSNQIFLFGHSLGGPVVSIAARDIPEIKGIILSASPGRSYADFNYEQTRYLLEWGQGLSGQVLETEMEKVKRADSLIDQPDQFCKEFPNDCQIKNGRKYLWGQSAQFWQEIDALDPLESLRSHKCQIFALHGSSDWMISSDNDGGAIARQLAGNPNFSHKTLDGLDHFLLKMQSKQASVKAFSEKLQGINLEIHPEFIGEVSNTLDSWLKTK